MFDISWSEFLLIGVVALVVIGPKELPAVMRTLGQWTRKVRGMASEFQNQFQEAVREAEMGDLKKQVDDLAADVKQTVTGYDPLKDVRDHVDSVGEDVKRSLASNSEPAAAEPAVAEAAETPMLGETPEAAPAPSHPMPAIEAPHPPPQTLVEPPSEELEPVGAPEPAPTEPKTIDKAVQTDETGRGG